MNLITNAIDFSPENNSQIWINIQKSKAQKDQKEELMFTIKDNGIGIPPENHKLLFDIFQKVPNKTNIKRKYGGSGLGLTICKGLVESHNGKIWLDTTYTTGASFVFTIPIIPIPL
jgi:signal transduction histidine kinase